jgi:hypothetical protein
MTPAPGRRSSDRDHVGEAIANQQLFPDPDLLEGPIVTAVVVIILAPIDRHVEQAIRQVVEGDFFIAVFHHVMQHGDNLLGTRGDAQHDAQGVKYVRRTALVHLTGMGGGDCNRTLQGGASCVFTA